MSVISVDLWGTLIKSSPVFVEAKVAFTKKYFPDLDKEKILQCFAETKKELNAIIEATGWQPEPELMFRLLFTKLNDGFHISGRHEEFGIKYNRLARTHSPIIYSEDTEEFLRELAEDHELILSSNTLLLDATTLVHALTKLDIYDLFSTLNFSCREGFSKPHPLMYGNSNFHIGDNPVTDGHGAKMAFSDPIIINSNNKTIRDAYDYITIQN